jgi:hypothetical protein
VGSGLSAIVHPTPGDEPASTNANKSSNRFGCALQVIDTTARVINPVRVTFVRGCHGGGGAGACHRLTDRDVVR